MAKEMREPIESGCPDPFQYMHPTMRRNFGMWAYHEHPRPGVLLHVAKNGDKLWTVKAGTQRILDLFTLRKLCDIAAAYSCPLYTSDAPDEEEKLDFGVPSNIKTNNDPVSRTSCRY